MHKPAHKQEAFKQKSVLGSFSLDELLTSDSSY